MSASKLVLRWPSSGFISPLGILLSLLLSFFIVAPASGETPVIPHGEAEVTVDGRLDESAWSQAMVLELPYETSPADNAAATIQTEALLFFTDTHLYVGFRAYDPEPERIRAYYRERGEIFGDDMVSITLDPYNGQRRGYQLFVNPLGVQADIFINELAGSEDGSFEAIWESAGRLTDFGYVVEMAVPFDSLSLPSDDGEMTWGLDLVRFHPRDYSRRLALSPLERGQDCYLCQIRQVKGFRSNAEGRRLEFTPEVSVAGREVPALYGDEIQRDSNVGATVQWAITPGMTLTGTVNPDFSQVAADPIKLDINQPFGIEREERRPFFQESADLFETPMDTVQTRNLVEPADGIKLAGQAGAQAVGLFHVRDRQLNLIRPGVEGASFERRPIDSESTAVRYRRDVLDESAIGLLATRRSATDYENDVLGVDGQLRFSDRDTLRYQWARSDTRDGLDAQEEAIVSSGDARRAQYEHERRHIYGGARHEHRDPGFRADLGFMPQTGFRENRAWLGTRWFGDGGGLLDEADMRIEKRRSDAVADGRPLERRDAVRFELSGISQSKLILYGQEHERWHAGERFEGRRWVTFLELEPFAGLRLRTEARGGQEIDFVGLRDGQSRSVAPGLSADIGRHVEVDLNYQRRHLDVPGGRLFQATTRELRAGWFFGVRTYLRLISQYSEIERNAALYPDGEGEDEVTWANQMTFTWQMDPRTEFIAGYSDRRSGLNQDSLELDARRVFLKMSYAFQI